MKKLSAAAAASALVVVGITAGPAAADPPPQPGDLGASVSCDDGSTQEIVLVPGQGNWTPGMATDSNAVYIPLAFDGFSGAAYDADTGELLGEFSDPSVDVKRAMPRGRTILHCTFTQTFYSPDDPDFGTDVVFEFSGGVTGMVTQ